ncbi:MAG: hypothetical protein FWH36_02240 [Lentimicrobiaceae bacterium]|nr:hypothetical protein [Lentimicrobiaceae bacterium]
MQKRNSLVIVIVFVLSASCLTAQNTGYMGKRVLFNMGAEFSPAWKRPVCDVNFKNKYLRFNCILSPSIEGIISQRGTVGVVYHYLSTKYNNPLPEEESYWEDEDGYGYYGETKYEVRDLTAHGFGVFYKLNIIKAPIGPYLKFQFDGFFFKCPTQEDRSVMMTDKLFGVKVEFGNDFLLFNRLRLSTGFSLGMPFGGFKALGHENEFFDIFNDIIGYNEQPYEYARSRILGAYWLGFTVNIGFLAF